MCVESSRLCRQGAPCTNCLIGGVLCLDPALGRHKDVPVVAITSTSADESLPHVEQQLAEDVVDVTPQLPPVAGSNSHSASHQQPDEHESSAELSLGEETPALAAAPAPLRKARRVRVSIKRASKRDLPDQPDLGDMDLLGRATAHFRSCLLRADLFLESCRQSKYYEVLSRTTQPAHIVAFLGVTTLAVLLFPAHRHQGSPASRRDLEPLPWTSLAYVVSFAAHFGSQFWMTFVSGLSLFFSLPRHHFAEVQKVLFPLYFTINSSFSLVTLATFLRLQGGSWDNRMAIQVFSMAVCFLIELGVRLYLTPPMIKLITVKTEIEKSVKGVGTEVGHYELGPLSHCPHYLKINAAFRHVHTRVAMANIASMACTAFHAHYLSSKLCL